MMTLVCAGLRKRYAGQPRYALGEATDGVSLEVGKGEILALLGPSGCGKTTTLRIIGGFIEPNAGTVEIEGVDVTHKPPYSRPTNTVFQSYALFPHMRLGANVAFGLSMERVPRAQRSLRVAEALELVGLGGMENRRVTELSGGQQQRAALARAIVKRPAVLLLDEPLGALDLRLRREMQDEIVRLKRTLETTMVHVTHDQEEACAIGDRIAVMDDGQIVQVDTPVTLYRHPRTTYVASFIDAGTIVRGVVERRGDVVGLENPGVRLRGPAAASLPTGVPLAAVLPHDRAVLTDAAEDARGDDNTVIGTVDRMVFTGTVFDICVITDSGLEIWAVQSLAELARSHDDAVTPGSRVALRWAPEDVHFVEDTGVADRSAAVDAPRPPADLARR